MLQPSVSPPGRDPSIEAATQTRFPNFRREAAELSSFLHNTERPREFVTQALAMGLLFSLCSVEVNASTSS